MGKGRGRLVTKLQEWDTHLDNGGVDIGEFDVVVDEVGVVVIDEVDKLRANKDLVGLKLRLECVQGDTKVGSSKV